MKWHPDPIPGAGAKDLLCCLYTPYTLTPNPLLYVRCALPYWHTEIITYAHWQDIKQFCDWQNTLQYVLDALCRLRQACFCLYSSGYCLLVFACRCICVCVWSVLFFVCLSVYCNCALVSFPARVVTTHHGPFDQSAKSSPTLSLVPSRSSSMIPQRGCNQCHHLYRYLNQKSYPQQKYYLFLMISNTFNIFIHVYDDETI